MLRRNTDTVVLSGMDYSPLAVKLYSQGIVTEDCYARVIDRKTGESSIERLQSLFYNVSCAVKENGDALKILLKSLEECERPDLVRKLANDYSAGMVFIIMLCITRCPKNY